MAQQTVDDFSHLLDAASRLEQMLGTADQAASNHDLMNVLTALRGYAELLREDVGAAHPDLDATLASLLAAVQLAHTGNTGQSRRWQPHDSVGAGIHPGGG